jgi:asparagine synthase (glutamine-hydrolysing)
MCGIIGGVDRLSSEARSRSVDLLKHRGPDHQEFVVLDHLHGREVWLGHARLAVMDTRAVANQPMFTKDRRYCVIFNGEIYNFKKLAEEHLRDYTFLTSGDTEVLVALWEKHGPRCLELLRGIFAFAVYDSREKKLTICRDHLGIKPLYYSVRGNGDFVFASEAAVLDAQAGGGSVDPAMVAGYLWYRYVPGEVSFYQGITRLPPGTLLERHADGSIKVTRYWAPVIQVRARSFPAATEELDSILQEAVAEQLVADVPVGIFLSGGVDSSLITAYANLWRKSPIDTFSIQFAEREFDESGFAAELSRGFNIKHHTIRFNGGISAWLPQVAEFVDEPLADPAVMPFYALSAYARTVVTVALSGDGADELFGGYKEYRADPLIPWLRLVPGAGYPVFSRLMSEHKAQRLHRVLHTRGRDHWPEWTGAVSYEMAEELAGCAPLSQPPGNRSRQQRLLEDLQTSLPNRMLMKVDKMSMAHGLEVRVPYLDPKVVDFALSLPIEHKVKFLSDKRVLRAAAARRLPRDASQRRKHGFNLPIAAWLRTSDRSYCRATLLGSGSALHGIVSGKALENMISEHEVGKADHSLPLFALLMLSECINVRKRRAQLFQLSK